MHVVMTYIAQCNKIFFSIIPTIFMILLMMKFKHFPWVFP